MYGGNIDEFVPPVIAGYIRQKFDRGSEGSAADKDKR